MIFILLGKITSQFTPPCLMNPLSHLRHAEFKPLFRPTGFRPTRNIPALW